MNSSSKKFWSALACWAASWGMAAAAVVPLHYEATTGAIVYDAVTAATFRAANNIQTLDSDLTTWAGVTPGTGVTAALAIAVGSSGGPVVLNGAGGTPSAIDLTNGVNLPAAGVTGTAAILGANTFTGIQRLNSTDISAGVAQGAHLTFNETLPLPDIMLNIIEPYSSATYWRGRITAGGSNARFLLGEYHSQAWMGAHNSALNAWADLHLQPDGGGNLIVGAGSGGTWTGKVGVGASSPSARMHIISTTEQTRVGYDTSNYISQTVGSTGAVTENIIGSGASKAIQIASTNKLTVSADGATTFRTATLAADDTYTGNVITGLTNSGGVTQWDAVYLNSSSQWVKAKADSSSTGPVRGVAIATAADAATVSVLISGTFRDDGGTAWTVGGNLYLSGATAGALTSTAPSTTGYQVQNVGFALANHTVCLAISPDRGTAP